MSKMSNLWARSSRTQIYTLGNDMIKFLAILPTLLLVGCAVYPVQPVNTVVPSPVIQQPVVINPVPVYRPSVIYTPPAVYPRRIYPHYHGHGSVNIRW